MSCELTCPYDPFTGELCSGHGACAAGDSNSTTGICSCDNDWFGVDCSIHCTVVDCRELKGLAFPQCNPLTGACECSTNPGRFVGDLCQDCDENYWGSQCNVYALAMVMDLAMVHGRAIATRMRRMAAGHFLLRSL